MTIKAGETFSLREPSSTPEYVLYFITVAVYPTYCSQLHAASPFLRPPLNTVLNSTPQAAMLHCHVDLIAALASFL